jgi:hypothetical protein
MMMVSTKYASNDVQWPHASKGAATQPAKLPKTPIPPLSTMSSGKQAVR